MKGPRQRICQLSTRSVPRGGPTSGEDGVELTGPRGIQANGRHGGTREGDGVVRWYGLVGIGREHQ